MSKGVTWMQYFSAETIPTSLDLHPIINLSCLHDMSSSRKKHLSPLAMRVPRRRNVSRQNGHGEQRVAPVENQPPVTVPQHTRGSGPAFVFGEIQGISFSYVFADVEWLRDMPFQLRVHSRSLLGTRSTKLSHWLL